MQLLTNAYNDPHWAQTYIELKQDGSLNCLNLNHHKPIYDAIKLRQFKNTGVQYLSSCYDKLYSTHINRLTI